MSKNVSYFEGQFIIVKNQLREKNSQISRMKKDFEKTKSRLQSEIHGLKAEIRQLKNGR